MRILPAFSVLLLPLLLSAGGRGPGEHARTRTGSEYRCADGGQHRAGRFRIPRYGLRRQLGRGPVSALSGPAQRSVRRKVPLGQERRRALWAVRATTSAIATSSTRPNYNRFGKMKASFAFNQIPLFFSEDTRTAYTTTVAGRPRSRTAIRRRSRAARRPARSTTRRAPLRLAAEADHHRLPVRLQRDRASRLQRVVQEHAEERRAAVGRDLRVQRRRRARGAGRYADDRCRRGRRVDRVVAARRASATTDRSSVTTSRRWSGTTRCDRPIRRPPGRRRAGWRFGRTAT